MCSVEAPARAAAEGPIWLRDPEIKRISGFRPFGPSASVSVRSLAIFFPRFSKHFPLLPLPQLVVRVQRLLPRVVSLFHADGEAQSTVRPVLVVQDADGCVGLLEVMEAQPGTMTNNGALAATDSGHEFIF